MFKRAFFFVLTVTLLQTQPSAAHEFWIEPTAHTIDPGDTVDVNIKVGQDYFGSTYSYLPTRFLRFDVSHRNERFDVKSTVGDRPAATLSNLAEGLHIVSYVSTVSTLEFRDWEKFKTYVRYEGNDWAIGEHLGAGLPETDFGEAYTRHAKALIQVGEPHAETDMDRPQGLKFELVALASPFTLTSEIKTLPVKLLWQGEPMAHQRINVFRRAAETEMFFVETDANGKAFVPVKQGGRYLLNAVRMFLTDEDAEQEWESDWASLTFTVGPEK